MKIHSAVGGKLGITPEEIEKLITLDRNSFEYGEWLILKYAQDWIILDGQEPAGDYMEEFRRRYSKRERGYFLKLIRMMRFANYWNNTFSGRPWRAGLEDSDYCSISGESRPG
jgi:hypothetical protein